MKPDQTPTVFVALMLAPDQFDLFDEIEAEAIDILDENTMPGGCKLMDDDELVVLDRDHIRIAMAWSTLPNGEDALTLAVGARHDLMLPGKEARKAADMMRQLVQRAEALFDVHRSLWQIALLPLNDETMRSHAKLLSNMSTETAFHGGVPFITFEPDAPKSEETNLPDKSTDDFLTGIVTAMNEANEEPSWAMQASALALSTAFVLVTPPVGIAMFAYAALRQGKDMDLVPQTTDASNTNDTMLDDGNMLALGQG